MNSDTYRHKGMRKKLIQEIREKGIRDEAVLTAMENVPRHLFMDEAFLEYSYMDRAFKIGAGQTISQPYTVAYMSELLQVQKGTKVLEIGTGSGYQAAVLAQMGAKVYSIERQRLLYDRTRILLPQLGYQSIKTFYGDGYKGLPTYAPFDRIIVTAGAPYIPEPLKEQLKPGGFLLIPVGEGDTQDMTGVFRRPDNTFEVKQYGKFKFVPLLEDREG
jgi:protein-L-isoaspartate(D-aspartate) O-methyltransferase